MSAPALILPLYALVAGATAALASPLAALFMLAPGLAAWLWLLPDQTRVSQKTLRRAFALMLGAELCIPAYYMLQIPGLPWISPRRLAMLALLALTFFRLATSAPARTQAACLLAGAPLLCGLTLAFDLAAAISIAFSPDPAASAQHVADMLITWRLPFLACLLAVGEEGAGARLARWIALLFLPVATLGLADFVAERNFTLDLLPARLLASMAEQNPGVKLLMDFNAWRSGFFRALSIYNTPLSFGESAAMVAPLAAFLVLHGARIGEKFLGGAALVSAATALFVSGSRGGALGFLVAMSLLALCWPIRLWRTRPKTLAGPIAALGACLTGGAALSAVFLWQRLANIVFGGGDSVGSTNSRAEQFAAAWPHVLESPIFGNGFGLSGILVDWRPSPEAAPSMDSYLISLLVETGFPGTFCYFAMFALAAGACLVIYLRDRDSRAALAGPVGCSLVAYILYRLVLSQRENQTLAFVLLGLALACAAQARTRATANRTGMAIDATGSGATED